MAQRGMGCEGGGRASRSLRARFGTAWACVGVAWGSGSVRGGRVAVRGRGEVFGGEWVVRSAGVHRAVCGRASGLRGRAEVLGKGVSLCGGVSEDLRRGMGGEGGGFNSHSPQQHARTCIIIYTSALSTP